MENKISRHPIITNQYKVKIAFIVRINLKIITIFDYSKIFGEAY